jgi:O-antigen/teichoic acid export membrane protein
MRNQKAPNFITALYVPILGIAMVIMTARLFAYAVFLDATNYGLLSLGFLVSTTFGMLAGFGSYIELQRQLPILYRAGRIVAPVGLTLNALAMNVILLALTAMALALYAMFDRSEGDFNYLLMFLIGALNGYFQQAFLILSAESKSKLDMVRYAVQNMIRSCIVVTAGMMAAGIFRSADAILIAELASTGAVVLSILHRQLAGAGIKVARLLPLTLAGCRRNKISALFVLSLLSLVASLSISVDRWIGAKVLDVAAFGQYSFALTAMLSALYLQSIINASAFSIFSVKFADEGARACFATVTKFSFGLLGVSLMASAILHPVLVALIRQFFAEYGDIGRYLYLLLIAASFRVSEYFSSYLVISRHERTSVFSTVGSVLVAVAVTFAFYAVSLTKDLEMLMAFFTAALAVSAFTCQLIVSRMSLSIGVDRGATP